MIDVSMTRLLRTLAAAAALLPVSGWTADVIPCAQQFSEFLARFESDTSFQAQSVRFPLRMAYLDDTAEPEPKQKSKLVTRDAYLKSDYPYYPTPEIQIKRKLEKKIVDAPASTKIVRFNQPDSDAYSIAFHFRQNGKCWQLIFLDDWSL